MNNLKNATCYLGGNLENSRDSITWREKITEELKRFQVQCLNPRIQCFSNQLSEDEESVVFLKNLLAKKECKEVHDFMQNIIRRDLRMCDRSDFLIVNLEPNLPTFGTTHEIVIASLQRKPILLRIDDIAKLPLWYCGLLDFDMIFEKWEDLINYIEKINSSETGKADPKYWKFWSEDFRQ